MLLTTAAVVVVVVEIVVDAAAAAAVGRRPAPGIHCAVPQSASLVDPAGVAGVDRVAGSGHCYCRCSEYC